MHDNTEAIEIIVNGRVKSLPRKSVTPGGELSFGEVVELAYDPPPSGPYIQFKITYRHSAGRPSDGTLSEGSYVKIQEGTVFNVTHVDKS